MTELEIKSVTKKFDNKTVLNNISFTVNDGEFLSILGPSGCGKTTLLKILIGIEKPSSGSIIKNGKNITFLDASKRGMGIVFQNYCLFPNMTSLENVSYALNLKIKNLLGLEEKKNSFIYELSGGQQQRVAIARTLVLNPDIILFDEPMSALDADNRLHLRKELKSIQNQFKTTMIYITHDQEEAFSLSDRVMVMNNGNIEQLDTPNKIFNEPASDYVKKFVTNHLIEKVSSIEKCTGIDL